jgi:hypothetical protein
MQPPIIVGVLHVPIRGLLHLHSKNTERQRIGLVRTHSHYVQDANFACNTVKFLPSINPVKVNSGWRAAVKRASVLCLAGEGHTIQAEEKPNSARFIASFASFRTLHKVAKT